MILAENFFLLDSSRQACSKARQLYHALVVKTDYQFIVLENWRQCVTEFSDYIKLYRAELDK